MAEPTTASTAALLGTAIAGKKALEKVVESSYNAAADQLKKRIKRWKTKAAIKTLYAKLATVRKVKTIWQVDKAVDLKSFYYPCKVAINGKPTVMNDVDDLGALSRVILTGTVGQGKSMLLRYLCARELQRGRRIPIFVELRRIELGETLVEHICAVCGELGLDVDGEMFEFLAACDKIHLFLDGCDEIADDMYSTLITQIERLAKKHDRLPITLTSRPQTGVMHSPHFQILTLSPIERAEVPGVLFRLMGDTDVAQNLIKALEGRPAQIMGLLSTPLMITLLAIKYKSSRRVPDHFSEFFDELFLLLLARHDQSKPGFMRTRRCKLDDKAMQDVFETFCFITYKRRKAEFRRREMQQDVAEALKCSRQPSDVNAFLDDVIKITCLIVDEGGKLRFIHKSAQEYHAAAFVRCLPEDGGRQFYKKGATVHGYVWHPILDFLEQIDRYRFERYYVHPVIEALLSPIRPGSDSKQKRDAWAPERIVSGTEFGIRTSGGSAISVSGTLATWMQARVLDWVTPFNVISNISNDIRRKLEHLGEDKVDAQVKAWAPHRSDDEYVYVWGRTVLTQGVVSKKSLNAMSTMIKAAVDRLAIASKYVEAEDAKAELFDMDLGIE